jgi:ESX secretion-associated protein EspK
MTVAKPTGEYADEMLDPGGWVETDEQKLYDRAQELTRTLQQLTNSLEGLQHEQAEIFNGGVWEGGGANAAKGKLGGIIDEVTGLQNDFVKAITWYQNVAGTVAQTKTTIADRVSKAQQDIAVIEDEADQDGQDWSDVIEALVKQVHGENVADVTGAAAKVPTSATWKPPTDALKNLLNQKAPPPVNGQNPPLPANALGGPGSPDAPKVQLDAYTAPLPGGPAGQAGDGGVPAGFAGQPGGPAPGPGGPAPQAGDGGVPAGFAGQPGGPMPAPGGPGAPQPSGGTRIPFNPSLGGISPLGGPGGGGPGGGGGLWNTGLNNAFGGQAGGQQNLGSLEAAAFGGHPPEASNLAQAGSGQGLGQSPPNTPLAQAAQAAVTNSASIAPTAAQGPPVTAETSTTAAAGSSAAGGVGSVGSGGGHGGGGGAGGGGGGGMGAPPGMSNAGSGAPSAMPLLPPATPHPAAPMSSTGGGTSGTPGTGSGGPGVHPASTASVGRAGFSGSMASSQPEAAPAPIPVSSARAQKDAIADATRRQAGGDVQTAYRLAAALNAADMVNATDFRFFWMTAVTADGQIVVANSYGLAYIPDAVNLPAQVTMVSADETVPVEERARWATYPNLALQGWAVHHNTTLKTVIAKREHFAGIDPGVPTQFVADEDIPSSGKMQGRSRLEVVDPIAGGRLASLSDLALVDMLPPAPVDATPPADQRSTLWWELMKHLMSSDADRGAAHLQAFSTYATHAQELALHRAYTAVHAVEQRAAVADWLYWQRIAGLLNDALASSAR